MIRSTDLPVLDGAYRTLDEGERTAADAKLDSLHELLAELVAGGVIVAFSGGVDSAFLLWATTRVEHAPGSILAVTALSPSVPEYDVSDARELATKLGVEHLLVPTNELGDRRYRRNDSDRCFYCKDELFRTLSRIGEERGIRTIVYGQNRSDRADYRPGVRAALNWGVRAPLDEVGLLKTEIRFLLGRAQIALSVKPSSPCLASRVGTGIMVTEQRLADVAALERLLRSEGIRTYRVRVSGEQGREFIRIEVGQEEFGTVLEIRDTLVAEGRRRGYRWTVLDLDGYRTGGGHQ